MSPEDWTAILLTLKLALVSTVILLVLATPLAWWLSRSQDAWRQCIAVVAALPIVLPPTVLGFYLLQILSPNGVIGRLSEALGVGNLLFTFEALVIGSVVYSFPFVMQPLHSAFIQLGNKPLELAKNLNAGVIDRFWRVVFPLTKHSFISAFVLGFAHTLGEFGVVLMIGGSIPGETQVVSIALYERVETLDFAAAHMLSFVLLAMAFILLLVAYRFNGWRVAN